MAGSGKTTLLAAWAGRLHRKGESITWVRAPEPGRLHPADVWRQVGRRSGVSGDGDTRYVFIDGLDRVEGDRPGLVGELVASAPEGIRLVVAGRTRPGAGPTRLRGDGSMVDVAPADLAFDRSELLALAAAHRLLLTDEETTILLQRTAGWVTGLMLIVPFLHGRNDSARLVANFDGDDPAVAGFLRSEIIAGWADGDENTMLRAAVRPVLSVDLAVEVTKRADAGAMLDRLAWPSALITRESGDDTRAYRIHPILLAYLQSEARRRDFVAAAAHETAARWFARRADGQNALEQALAAGLPILTAEMLDAFGLDLVLRGTPDLVLRALAEPATRAGDPGASVTASLRLLLDAPYFPDRGQAGHLLAELETAGLASGGSAKVWTVVIDALAAFFAATPDEIRDRLARLGAVRTAPGRRKNLGVDLLAATAEAWCRAGLGEAERAEAGLRMVAVTARNAGYQWLFLLAGDLAAVAASRRGDWARASLIDDQLARATGAAARPATGAGASWNGLSRPTLWCAIPD
ncbi:hypothetical protein [Cryobacterium sp. TMT2-42-4]|uniref:hypothetical protein n=1 Tax=Cryobacterium sp. TMT2-42-4 TaxID=1259255 RepID=UPI00106BAB5C|nr:hypothetical protein [Cryobacterium sp. TMT2-42-4]TFC39620.1 hypothetical protein E3O18_01870 [Cryobacterium sp. TMT2-42-4]